MGKSFVKAVVKSQFNILKATNNADRLRFMLAKVEDGKMFTNKGECLGEWDGEDEVFITPEDAELSRITTSKINSIYSKVSKYFELEEPSINDEPTETDSTTDDAPLEVDVDEVIAKCKKAIKKGNVKKAKKFLAFLDEDTKAFKKLSKKIKEL